MSSSTPQEVVFITGASAGIGEACATAYAQQGAALVLLARRQERLTALAAKLRTPCHLVAVDVQDRAAVERAIAALPPPFDAVSVLINSAGLALGLGPAQQAKMDDWETMVRTNVMGAVVVTKALLTGMVARNRGHIVNLGSVAGTYPYPGGNIYGATKAFIHQFTLNLRSDLLGTAVRLTNIEPGMVETDFSLVRFGGDAAKAAAVYQGLKALSAQDISDTVLWCTQRPAHVNINTVELMPVAQAFGAFAVKRDG